MWREIIEGIKSVGILEMEIYIEGTRLFMIVETPVDFEWGAAMERLASLPLQSEWAEYMAMFLLCEPGSSSSQKWTLMARMFHLYI